MLYPVKLQAPLKDYLWGGTRLRDEYGKETDLEKVAESWELSCHHDGESVIAQGEDKGLTLREYIEREGKQVLGSRCEELTEFNVFDMHRRNMFLRLQIPVKFQKNA